MRAKVDMLPVRSALLMVGLLTLSCTANRMYRPESVEEHPDYSLAFIEFDDQGELWAPSQLEQALALLERHNRPGELGSALVLFVHGWNNSASPSEDREQGGVVYQFREILTRLKQDHRRRYPDYDGQVVGIYLGWRGEVSSVPLLRQLSFYNRRGAAERIAGASATEAIYRILTTSRANPYSRSVLIGHSFGSMILERALAQAMISALLASPGQELIFPADLVVLLNPAGSAIQTKQMVDILARTRLKTYRFDEKGQRYERPLLLSFTSETDKATRTYFPLGMSLKATSKKFRSYGAQYCSAVSSQRWLYSHTAGHTPALHSHTVTVGPKSNRPGAEQTQGPEPEIAPRYQSEYDPLTKQMALSFDGEEHRFTIKRKPRALNDTPYWIMQVPPELIPNHSQVFSADTFALVEAALGFSGALQEDASTTVVREDGVRPVVVVPRPDGGALFVDRSRAVYAVRSDSPRPVFLSCLSEDLDPSYAIGFHVAGHLAYAALVRPASGTASKCQTEIYEFQVENRGYRQLDQIRVASSDCYTAAAFDVPGERVYLSYEEEGDSAIFVADLSQSSPRPSRFVDLPGTRPATVMFFEATGQRLFTAQTQSGALWVVDLGADTPQLRPLADSLGWPMALGFGRTTKSLYVTDAKNRSIWEFDCRSQCQQPTVFLQSDSLKNPTTLAVALDGTLWLGDRQDQTLMTIAPDGSIKNTIYSISGAPASSNTPVDNSVGENNPPP